MFFFNSKSLYCVKNTQVSHGTMNVNLLNLDGRKGYRTNPQRSVYSSKHKTSNKVFILSNIRK